jgi:hypothetical protein
MLSLVWLRCMGLDCRQAFCESRAGRDFVNWWVRLPFVVWHNYNIWYALFEEFL